MTTEVHFFDVFSKKDPYLNAVENLEFSMDLVTSTEKNP